MHHYFRQNGVDMKYIMCAKTFPAYHPKAGQPTGFKDSILNGTKLHTLRDKKGNRETGDIVSLREWSGKPYASKQVTFAECEIEIVPEKLDRVAPSSFEVKNLARCDGFSDPEDFVCWFTGGKVEPITFDGFCIWFLYVKRTTERSG